MYYKWFSNAQHVWRYVSGDIYSYVHMNMFIMVFKNYIFIWHESSVEMSLERTGFSQN